MEQEPKSSPAMKAILPDPNVLRGRDGFFLQYRIGRVYEKLDKDKNPLVREDGNPDVQIELLDEIDPLVVFDNPAPLIAYMIEEMFKYFCADNEQVAAKALEDIASFVQTAEIVRGGASDSSAEQEAAS